MEIEAEIPEPTAETIRAEALLTQIGLLSSKHEARAAASGQNFNLFRILGQETREVRTHSAMLAELLNPNGSHGQGPVFARLFAERLPIEGANLDNAGVRTEVTIEPFGRLDIRLLTDDTCLVIENKVQATDGTGQLERYQKYVNSGPWRNSRVIYLTLHGEEPSEKSLGSLQLKDVTCFSYDSDIIEWLDDCIKEVARVPQIREILAHYRALLHKLTGKSTGELTMELKELLEKRQGDNTYNYKLVPKLHKAMMALSVETEWNFWQLLKEKLLECEGQTWSLVNPVEPILDPSNPLKEVAESVVDHAHKPTGRNKWNYGWTFRVKSPQPDLFRSGQAEILLRVECDEGWVYCGLIAVESAAAGRCLLRRSSSGELFEDWAQRLSESNVDWHTTDERWLAWGQATDDCYLWKNPWLAPDDIERLRDDKGEVVDMLVQHIRTAMGAISG